MHLVLFLSVKSNIPAGALPASQVLSPPQYARSVLGLSLASGMASGQLEGPCHR